MTGRGPKRGDYKRALLDHAASLTAATVAVTSLFVGARLRELRSAVEGIARKITGDWDGPEYGDRPDTRFASIGHALTELVVVGSDGYSLPATGDPDRLRRLVYAPGRSEGSVTRSRATEQAEDLLEVRRAWEGAFCSDGCGYSECSRPLCERATLLRYVGGWACKSRTRECPTPAGLRRPAKCPQCGTSQFEARPYTPTEVSCALTTDARPITARQVAIVTARAGQLIWERLRSATLVPAYQRRHPMAKRTDPPEEPFLPYDLASWDEIARYVDRPVSTVRRWAEIYALPVYRCGGGVYASRSDLRAWRERVVRSHPVFSPVAHARKPRRMYRLRELAFAEPEPPDEKDPSEQK